MTSIWGDRTTSSSSDSSSSSSDNAVLIGGNSVNSNLDIGTVNNHDVRFKRNNKRILELTTNSVEMILPTGQETAFYTMDESTDEKLLSVDTSNKRIKVHDDVDLQCNTIVASEDIDIATNDTERMVIEHEGDIVLANNSVLHSRRIDMTKVERFTNRFNTGIEFVNDRTQANITVANTAVYTTALILTGSNAVLSVELKILDNIDTLTNLHIGGCTAEQSRLQLPDSIFKVEDVLSGFTQNDIIRVELDLTGSPSAVHIYKNDTLESTTDININFTGLRVYIFSEASSASFAIGTVIGNNESNVESSIKTTLNFRMLDVNDQKFIVQENDELELLSSGVENFIVNSNNDLITANSATIHNRSIDQNLQERFTNDYLPGENVVNFSNSQTKTTNIGANVANYSVSQVFSEGDSQQIKWEVRYNPGASDIFTFGICDRDDSYKIRPDTFDSATLTGLVKTDIIEVRFDSEESEFTYYLNDIQQGTFSLSIPSTNPWRWFIMSDAGSSEFQLSFLKSTSQQSDTGIIKVCPNFSMRDFNNNKFLEHQNEELKIAEAGVDVIRVYQPLEGGEGTEFQPYDVSLSAMSPNIEFELDSNEDEQVINVLSSFNGSAVPNVLPFRPDINYEQEGSFTFKPQHTVTNSDTAFGVGFYSTVPLNYTTASGSNPSSLYGSNYFMVRSLDNLNHPWNLPANMKIIYRSTVGNFYRWDTPTTREFTLTITPTTRDDLLGYDFNWLYAQSVRLLTIFCQVLDQNNPADTNFELFIHRPSQGTYTFDTDLSVDGSNVEIQGYEVKTEFDRLVPYEYNKFSITDSATIGILNNNEYVIDFDNGSNNDFTITEVSETEVNVVKTANTNFSISYTQNGIDVAKYNWVVECILNSANGSSCRLQLGSTVYVPSSNSEAFSDGKFGSGYSVNFRPGTGSLYSTVSVLNNLATIDSIDGQGASLDKVRYTINDGLLSAEYQLSTDSSYQQSPVLNVNLLGGKDTEYYLSLNDSQTNYGGFDCNITITRTERETKVPAVNIHGDSSNAAVINFDGDLHIQSNATQYMNMSSSQVLLNQPLMLRSGDTNYMLSLTNQSGLMFYNSEYNKMVISTDNVWLSQGESVELIAAEDVDTGHILELVPSGSDLNVRKAQSTEDEDVVGVVCWENGLANEYIAVATTGRWPILCEASTYTVGDRITVDTDNGVGRIASSESLQPFAFSLESKTLASNGLVQGLLHCQEIY